MYVFLLQIAGSMMGTQPLPPHQQPGGGGPLGLKKQQDFLGKHLTSTNEFLTFLLTAGIDWYQIRKLI